MCCRQRIYDLKKPFFIEYDSDTDEANVNLGNVPFLFNDKIAKKSFKATEVGSMDGTVRIAQVGNGQTPDGDPIYNKNFKWSYETESNYS